MNALTDSFHGFLGTTIADDNGWRSVKVTSRIRKSDRAYLALLQKSHINNCSA